MVFVSDLVNKHERQRTRPTIEEVEHAFTKVARNFDQVYVVADALDECDSLEVGTFVSHSLASCSGLRARRLVTSGKHPQVEQIYEDSARFELRSHDEDTLQYLQSRARREFPAQVLRDAEALGRVFSALLLSADGIPLIARLHMNALRGLRTPGKVYDETYQRAMERITKQPGELPVMATKVLRWVVCARIAVRAGDA